VRSPYGRAGAVGLIFGRLLAERGLQVVIQSVRGTFGSGGAFDPFDERADGLATLRWIREQVWHAGPIGMIGPSYLGLVQWAVAADPEADLAALAVQVSASQFHAETYAGGSLSLETSASWLVLVAEQERRFPLVAIARALRRLPALLSELPLSDLDELATGGPVDWYREAAAHPEREDAYWVARDYSAGVATVAAPVQLIGGWYDIFLPWMLEDFCALQDAGRRPQLIIGPWTHTAPGTLAAGIREGLGWLRAGLLGDDRLVRPAAVSVFVTGVPAGTGAGDAGAGADEAAGAGADEAAGAVDFSRGERWRELPSWPPPGTGEYRLWLAGEGRLVDRAPDNPDAGGERYRYDPSDPTPSVGGPVLLARDPVVDNRTLEARPDVLAYTGPPLPDALEAIGPVRVELYARTSLPHFDLFARVCDVDRDGASWNVSDALARVDPEHFHPQDDDSWRVAFDLWPMGHRFGAGHLIRLQVSSGAHPRYARNPGTGADPFAATVLRPVDVEILHDQAHPSHVSLPRPG
jgi:uncharacterized protein